MLSRSVVALHGRAVSSPLSPLSASFTSPSISSLDPEQRLRLLHSGRKVRGLLGASPYLEVTSPLPETETPPRTAIAYGFDTSIMERLQTALSSPFSPRTLVRNMTTSSSTGRVPQEAPVLQCKLPSTRGSSLSGRNDGFTPALKNRRKHVPTALPLGQTTRLPETSPLSPFRYGAFATKASKTPISPTTLLRQMSPNTTVASINDTQIRRQKLDKFARYVGASVPDELVYSSFGEIVEQIDRVGTHLDRHQTMGDSEREADTRDLLSPRINLKSPLPQQTTRREWIDIDLKDSIPKATLGKSSILRQSRSLGDLHSEAESLRRLPEPIQRPPGLTSETRASTNLTDQSTQSTHDMILPSIQVDPPALDPAPQEDQHQIQRKASLEKAKRSILGDDAKHMAKYRHGQRAKPLPLELKLDPVIIPFSMNQPELPSPPTPSPLLAVKSPRVPYWVKPTIRTVPTKTPRTLRTERRQGWGGPWSFWSLRSSSSVNHA